MKRKNKVMLALALGAVVLVIGSGAARCSLAPAEDAPASEQEATQPSLEAAGAIGDDPEVPGQAGAQCGFADLKNTSWESEDGKSALSIIEGAFIESGEEGQSILYYTVDEEQVRGSDIEATLSVSSSMTGDEEKTVAVVSEAKDGTFSITCDKLRCAYEMRPQQAMDMSIVGSADELYSAFGKSEDEFEDVLLDYARANIPSASEAAWGKEVWIDYGANTFLTNFTLNDAASTIVTVQKDASGKLAAL